MKLFSVGVISVFCVLLLSAPQGASAANFDVNSRLDAVRDRISALNERFEKRLQEVEERVGENRNRVCERLMDFGHTNLPPFCDDGEEPEPDAPTLDFSADPDEIDEGATSTLSWDIEDADECTASDGWSGDKGTSGDEEVSPATTTTYTLLCVGEGGTTTESVTVTVHPDEPEPDAPTVDIDADPMTIDEGATSTLSWNTTNADTCEASDGWVGNRATTGNEVVSPTSTTTYTLECVGGGGTTTESVTVTVEPVVPVPDVPTLDFSADPTTVLAGATSTLTWDSENADTCEASDGWSGTKTVDGNEDVTVNATTTYTLECVGEGGTTTESVTVNVTEEAPQPTVDHLLISEVFYDVDGAHGSEGDNEWVEIYNPTDSTVDLMNWVIGSASTTGDVIATTSLPLGSGEYLVITNATTTDDFWDLSGAAQVVYLGNDIGNGLANTSDFIALWEDENGFLIDMMSYGSNVEAFDPAAPDVIEGHSLARDPVDVDTDTASDWTDSDTPTPGT